MKTYAEIQIDAAALLGVQPSSVKTCWIAQVMRAEGLPVGTAHNSGKGRGAPPCPPRYRQAILQVL